MFAMWWQTPYCVFSKNKNCCVCLAIFKNHHLVQGRVGCAYCNKGSWLNILEVIYNKKLNIYNAMLPLCCRRCIFLKGIFFPQICRICGVKKKCDTIIKPNFLRFCFILYMNFCSTMPLPKRIQFVKTILTISTFKKQKLNKFRE